MTNKKKYLSRIKDFVVSLSHINKDPLDGDQTEMLARYFHIELDFQNGNITSEEYNEKYAKLSEDIYNG